MILAINWTTVADVMGVLAFLVVLLWAGFRSVPWIWRDHYQLSRIEKAGNRPEAYFIFSNPGLFSRTVQAGSITVQSNGMAEWAKATFVPDTAADILTVISPGTQQVQKVRMLLIDLDGVTPLPGPADENLNPTVTNAWLEIQHGVVGSMLLHKMPVTVSLSTSDGRVLLNGATTIAEPVARELFQLGSRLKRIVS